jgi:hypothetical protein
MSLLCTVGIMLLADSIIAGGKLLLRARYCRHRGKRLSHNDE